MNGRLIYVTIPDNNLNSVLYVYVCISSSTVVRSSRSFHFESHTFRIWFPFQLQFFVHLVPDCYVVPATCCTNSVCSNVLQEKLDTHMVVTVPNLVELCCFTGFTFATNPHFCIESNLYEMKSLSNQTRIICIKSNWYWVKFEWIEFVFVYISKVISLYVYRI